jgi:eukaryotic-like serine/threonine-protein kinase
MMDALRDAATQSFELPVHKGDVFGGRYEVDRVLGSGGMGMVVRAKHVRLDEMVAIKFLLPGASYNPEKVARFEREARAAAKIKGDHVARVLDLGSLESGMPYIVMEYLDGEDLDQRLQRRGPLSVGEAVDFVTQACEAMAEAHALGIIHRDLKSSNLFVVQCPDGSERVKVLDFGIAKVAEPAPGDSEESRTRTMAVMGSPSYMSPEQLKSTRDVDARTDVWALGVILHELLSGYPPFDGDGLPELYVNIASGPPARVRRPDVPEALEAVILKCLAKSKDDRYRDVAELALALAPFGPPCARDAAHRAWKITRAAMAGKTPTTRSMRGRKAMAVATGFAAVVAALAVFGAMRSCGGTGADASVHEPASLETHAPEVR